MSFKNRIPGLLLLSVLCFCLSAHAAETPTTQPTLSFRPATAEIGDTLIIIVQDWPASRQSELSQFVPYFDGVPIKGLTPLNVDVRSSTTGVYELRYPLKRTKTSDESWRHLLDLTRSSKTVTLSIGTADKPETSIPAATGLTLVLVPASAQIWAAVFLVILIFLLIWLDRSKGLLRDRDTDIQPDSTLVNAPMSLARTQMAAWLVVIVWAVMYLGIMTGNWFSTLSVSAAALLGISAGTALGGAMIDTDKKKQHDELSATQKALKRNLSVAGDANAGLLERAQAKGELAFVDARLEKKKLSAEEISSLRDRQASLKTRILELETSTDPTTSKELAEKTRELAEIETKLSQLTDPKKLKHEGFISDILSDADGISLHRFQIAVWTTVLVLVFIASVIRDLAMPEFSNALLGLMGISAGTYLGFKFPERKAA